MSFSSRGLRKVQVLTGKDYGHMFTSFLSLKKKTHFLKFFPNTPTGSCLLISSLTWSFGSNSLIDSMKLQSDSVAQCQPLFLTIRTHLSWIHYSVDNGKWKWKENQCNNSWKSDRIRCRLISEKRFREKAFCNRLSLCPLIFNDNNGFLIMLTIVNVDHSKACIQALIDFF